MSYLPDTGYLRLRQIIGDATASPPIAPLIPVGKSTWWAGVKSGRYPQPVRTLGERITAWRVEDIRALIDRASTQAGGNFGGNSPNQNRDNALVVGHGKRP